MPETALAVIETINAIDLFNPEIIQPKLDAIRVQVMAEAATLDISTPGNRSAIAALAYKVGRSKTFIDKQRLDLVGEQKKALKKIDAQGSANWDFLETLQKEVRKPLTDWEDAEKDRVGAHEEALAEIEEAGKYTMSAWATLEADAIRDRMREIDTDTRDYEEFSTKHAQVKAYTLKQMSEALGKRVAYDEQQAELARLRAESSAREQREREERIAREATEKAQREAKEREVRAAREHQQAVERAQREKEAAEARAHKAEQDAKQAAAVAEAQHQAAQAAEVAAAKAREKDRANKAQIHNAIVAGLMKFVPEDKAKEITKALAKGEIPCIKVVY